MDGKEKAGVIATAFAILLILLSATLMIMLMIWGIEAIAHHI